MNEKKMNQLISDLNSGSETKISQAIKTLEEHGDSRAIKPLANVLLTSDSPDIQKEILELFSSLKDSSSAVEVMDILQDPQFAAIRPAILTTVWNTKVDFSSYIDDFVGIAVQGDFMEVLDCLTIIENMEGPFMEEDILECQLHLKNYLEDSSPKDQQKAELLSEIALKVKMINESLNDL